MIRNKSINSMRSTTLVLTQNQINGNRGPQHQEHTKAITIVKICITVVEIVEVWQTMIRNIKTLSSIVIGWLNRIKHIRLKWGSEISCFSIGPLFRDMEIDISNTF